MLSAALQRLRSERAIALPAAVSMLFITMTLAGTAATVAFTAGNQSSRDRNEKRALEAADAGIDEALFRINNGRGTFDSPALCTTVKDGKLTRQTFPADYWCPSYAAVNAVHREDMGDGATFSFQWSSPTWPGVSPTWLGAQYVKKITVVSTGTAGNVTRRLRASLIGPVGGSALSCYTVIGQTGVSLYNDSRIDHNGQSNTCGVRSDSTRAWIDATDGKIAVLCDKAQSNVTSGSPSPVTFSPPDSWCANWASDPWSKINAGNGPPLQVDQTVQCPSGATPPCLASQYNDNARIDGAWPAQDYCWAGTQGYPYKQPWEDPCVYDRDKRTLKINGDAVLGLTGSVYSFCDIQTMGGHNWDWPFSNEAGGILANNPTKANPLRIYIDSPEHCPGVVPIGGAYRVHIDSLCRPYTVPTAIWLYVLGSTDPLKPTTLQLVRGSGSFPTACMVVYAPNTAVETRGVGDSKDVGDSPTVGTIEGAVVGKSVSLYGNPTGLYPYYAGMSDRILADDDTDSTAATVTPVFYRQPGSGSWEECTPQPTGSDPASGCL